MGCLIATLLLVTLALTGDLPAAGAATKLRVVATIPDLKSLTEAVGGALVEVDSLARGTQNPHDLEVRPQPHVEAPPGPRAHRERARARGVGRARSPRRQQPGRRSRRSRAHRCLARRARHRSPEDRRGIPPSPAHLARLVRQMKDARTRVIVLVEPWSDGKLAQRVAEEAGATVAVVNARPARSSGTEAYLDSMEADVTAVVQAAR